MTEIQAGELIELIRNGGALFALAYILDTIYWIVDNEKEDN